MLHRSVVKFPLAFLLSLSSLPSIAQSPTPESQQADATKSSSGREHPSDGITHAVVGQSLFALNGPWKFSIGDSPIDPATQRPLWAEPGFDDSHWEDVDLTAPAGSFNPVAAVSGYVPGWTAKGHPGYSGYGWYRIRVKVQNLPDGGLAMTGPSDVDDAFQLFANGKLLGSFGDFPASASHPIVYLAQPTLFPIPASVLTTSADRTQLFAFRIWMSPSALLIEADTGGMHSAPLFGQADAVSASYQLKWAELIRAYVASAIVCILFLLLAVLALSLSVFDRSDKVYYWIAGVYALTACANGVLAISSLSQAITGMANIFETDVILRPLILACWVMVWWVWFQLRRPLWPPWAVAILTPINIVSQLLGEEIIFGLIPHPVAVKFHLLSVATRLAFLALLVLIFVLGVRQKGREGWIALPTVPMLGASLFQNELGVLHVRASWFPFGVQISLNTLASLLLWLALSVLLLRRLFLSLHTQQELALDIQQAAEVQHVILPESRADYAGLTVETEYRPAREVGGDFFQVIAHPGDGSLLLVAGDVAGKGLQAGMLVALLVGATRSTAELNPDPLFLLEALNRRLLGRSSAQATALALRIAADGSATLANAGHIPPYVNGKTLEVEGSLPLGMIDGAEFSVMHFQLHPGDRLVLITDGVLEATSADGQLFGFDRVADLLLRSTAVKAIADTAQLFGQNDDISLVAVTRTM